MLGMFQAILFVFLQLLEDVSLHGDIKGAFIIIPFEDVCHNIDLHPNLG